MFIYGHSPRISAAPLQAQIRSATFPDLFQLPINGLFYSFFITKTDLFFGPLMDAFLIREQFIPDELVGYPIG